MLFGVISLGFDTYDLGSVTVNIKTNIVDANVVMHCPPSNHNRSPEPPSAPPPPPPSSPAPVGGGGPTPPSPSSASAEGGETTYSFLPLILKIIELSASKK